MKHIICIVVYYFVVLINMGIAKYYSIYPSILEDNWNAPCNSTEQCEIISLNGYICENNLCKCENTECAKATAQIIVTKIGKDCKTSNQCYVDQSFCNQQGKCDCMSNTVVSQDKRKCLNVSYTFGSDCQESIQCKLLNGICRNGRCRCSDDMHLDKGICFKSVALEFSCKKNEECSHIPYSSCISGLCACAPDYVKSKTNKGCLLKVNKIHSICSEDVQCFSTFGPRSICLNNICECTELYQYNPKTNKCVLDGFLGETCGLHSDCHQPERGESRLECIVGVCKCKPDYFEEEGFCIPNSSRSNNLPFIIPHVFFYITISLLYL